MILQIAGTAQVRTEANPDVAIILPAKVVGPDQIRDQAGDLQSGQLTGFVLDLTGELLREGVTLHAGDERQQGIHVRVDNGAMEIDLTEPAIAALLLEHIQPRFRAVLEGMIQS
ncbi:MAG: hypothetical protein GDA40_11830 [Rhodobacteraceae bacterium]|nr:hypothetical protein [Paracoccaceae bacterium]